MCEGNEESKQLMDRLEGMIVLLKRSVHGVSQGSEHE